MCRCARPACHIFKYDAWPPVSGPIIISSPEIMSDCLPRQSDMRPRTYSTGRILRFIGHTEIRSIAFLGKYSTSSLSIYIQDLDDVNLTTDAPGHKSSPSHFLFLHFHSPLPTPHQPFATAPLTKQMSSQKPSEIN
jgi:hypothetical protein